ncbi:hypothetical protein SCHRY_v1c07500 [Spiroplasma chrysopicola DF-1]|uniref:Uncharacterized protein n=1 Tax=Spiroplasma chrysopicola DF-1 TaxID=1276227 RepID=R4UJ31_9MOLU|nr:hypothetical protein SCHRY_v1c07500 [Spiroplasma chrysopicola DF-1]
MLFLLLGGISLFTASIPSLYQSINLLQNNNFNNKENISELTGETIIINTKF